MRKVLIGEFEGGRCHYCGYNLKGLEKRGNCPECGTEYTEESALRLKPWPEAYVIFMRLGWPLFIGIGLFIPFFLGVKVLYVRVVIVVITMFEVATINVYFQVGSMFKRHLPEQKRTQGPITGLRVIGSMLAVVVTLLFLEILWRMQDWYF